MKNGTGPLIFASAALQNNGLNVNAGAIAQVPDQLKYSILVGFSISLVCVLWCADWFSSFAQENLRAMTYFFWAARPDPPKCKVGRANKRVPLGC